jgi:hypothetical protein
MHNTHTHTHTHTYKLFSSLLPLQFHAADLLKSRIVVAWRI